MATFINDIQAALDRHLNLLVYSLDYGSVSNASVLNDDWGSIIIEPTSGVNYGALTELVTPPIAWPNINYEPTTTLICALGFYLSPLSKQAWVEAAKT
jgi:hypothetical protein